MATTSYVTVPYYTIHAFRGEEEGLFSSRILRRHPTLRKWAEFPYFHSPLVVTLDGDAMV